MSPVEDIFSRKSFQFQTSARDLAADALHTIAVWIDRAGQRRTLQELEDHLLADIGKTRAEAVAESRKRFWER
jgi:uncharacterized protein YjiS (DUF1127 family)